MPWLASTILSATLFVARPLPAPIAAAAGSDALASDTVASSTLACDDGTIAGTLVQPGDAAYGNRFTLGCARGHVLRATFVHFGAGFVGPYAYRLQLFDADCRPLATTEPLMA